MTASPDDQAMKLAQRDYDSIVTYCPEGWGPDFVAITPELGGCVTQGYTREDALSNLVDARATVIAYLLEKHLPVPEPAADNRAWCGSVHIQMYGGMLT